MKDRFLFRVCKIQFFKAPKDQNSCQGCFGVMKKRFLSDLENSLFQSVIILKVCFGVTKKRFLSDSDYSFLRVPKHRKLLESCLGSMKRDLFRIQKIWFSWGGKTEIASCSFVAPTKRYVSDSENWIFQDAKTLEVPSMSFGCHEKGIFFGFGKFASSGCQNRQFLQVSFSAIKNRIISYTENWRFQESKGPETTSQLFWHHEKRLFKHSKNSLFLCAETLQIQSSLSWHHEKAISSGLGKFAFLGRQN